MTDMGSMTTQHLNPLVNEITWADSATPTESPQHDEGGQDDGARRAPGDRLFISRA